MRLPTSICFTLALLAVLGFWPNQSRADDDPPTVRARAMLRDLALKSPKLTLGKDSVADRFQCDIMVSLRGEEDERITVRYRVQRVGDRAAVLCIADERRVEALIQHRRFVFASPRDGRDLDWVDGDTFVLRFPDRDESPSPDENGASLFSCRLLLPEDRGEPKHASEIEINPGRIWEYVERKGQDFKFIENPARIVALGKRGTRAELDLAPRGSVYPVTRFRLEGINKDAVFEISDLMFGDAVDARLITTNADDLRKAGFAFSERPLDRSGVVEALGRMFDGPDDAESTCGRRLYQLLATEREMNKQKPRSP